MTLFVYLKLAIFFSSVLLQANALNIGVQSVHSDIYLNKVQECSRQCESEHCAVPPFLRYGKYCGILYSGCPGEKPCDFLDACCMAHDACINTNHNDYLSTTCNSNLLDCISAFKKSNGQTFRGNKCNAKEVADVIHVVIEAALLAGKVLHRP